ncbi:hypothetical protein MAR_027582 [Mya arenaria]|uniref:Uncharacterized protein n=1 Tax=Mya arenaria TaxID=6604 RepID=A0ABY7ETW1_MYAAR|nr:hypothetical protein MAR_027582 [Mya arenaria]
MQKNSKEDKRQKEEEAVIKGHNIRKAVLLYSVIVNRLRKRYKMTKTHTEKRNIASLVCATGLIRRYRLADYARKMIGVTTHQMKRKPRRQQIHIKATRVRKAVHSFFERDDNSRIKADKKATITRKGEKKQIRLLNDDIKNLHSKYNSEMGNNTTLTQLLNDVIQNACGAKYLNFRTLFISITFLNNFKHLRV